MAPFAPHIGEELWEQLGGTDSVFHAQWPECDAEAMKDDEIEIGVQVNGKARGVVISSGGCIQGRRYRGRQGSRG